MFGDIYKGKKVLITGHTGFKGSWLSLWLSELGAELYGYALNPIEPEDDLALFEKSGLTCLFERDVRADINDATQLTEFVRSVEPDFIFHLAAQPLVRLSYIIPSETFQTNVMGTVNLLQAARGLQSECVTLCITTDKCYENKEWLFAYRENESMGGHDPYSASKGAAELVASSYRNSFASESECRKTIATVRAGNVIGGGDWCEDRIIPDCIRAINKGESIKVRNKTATRPWQHVLEPLSGYLWLAAVLSENSLVQADVDMELFSSFNFGPNINSNKTVAELVDEFVKCVGGSWEDHSEENAPHEASKLNLAIDKAFHLLKWHPVWDFQKTVKQVAEWYKNVGIDCQQGAALKFSKQQIEVYTKDAEQLSLLWAR